MSEDARQELARHSRVLESLPYVEQMLLSGDERLPSMVVKAVEMFHDDTTERFETKTLDSEGRVEKLVIEERRRVDNKTKMVILNTLARMSGYAQEVLASKGLKATTKVTENHLHVTLNLLSPAELARIPVDLREKMERRYLAAVRGEALALPEAAE